MKAIVCEMCGSQNLVKEDGMYVCQSCGTKYSTEEAKKLTVEVSETVKVDNTERIENYYQLARRAKEEGNSAEAAKYYDLIRQDNPNDWESTFFATYFASIQTNIAGIENAAYAIANSVVTSLKLVSNNAKNQNDKEYGCYEIGTYINKASTMLFTATMDHYSKYSTVSDARQEKENRVKAIAIMQITLGDTIEAFFSEDYEICKNISTNSWKLAFDSCRKAMVPFPKNKDEYINKIKKYEPAYQESNSNSGGGCYVATAVYGSYDCPQVWTLRRYRDDTLAKTWYGRLFIHTYYAISPTLVKWFGNTDWFRNMWKPKLDRMVSNLNSEGVDNTPYEDKNW